MHGKHQAQVLLDAIITATSTQERKRAKQAWKSYLNAVRGLPNGAQAVIEQYMREARTWQNHKALAAFVQALQWAILSMSHTSPEDYRTCANFTLEMLQHESGTVREAMRHSACWLRHPHSRGKQATALQKEYHAFIDRMEGLIDKHTPQHTERFLTDQPPSLYRSLVAAWFDLAPYTIDPTP